MKIQMKKKNLVTLKEALPVMVRVFCGHANGLKKVWNYAIKNDKCINHYIYFAAEKYMAEEVYRCEGDKFYTEMFRDIYRIVEMILKEPIPMNIFNECIAMASEEGDRELDGVYFARERIIMGTVVYLLETLDARKDEYYLHCMNRLKVDYGKGRGLGDFYELLSKRLSAIKDKPLWCDDVKKLSEKTEFEKNHEAWVDEFFGVRESATESSSENALPETEPNSIETSPDSHTELLFCTLEDERKWVELVKQFIEENNIRKPLDGYVNNETLAMIHLFHIEWGKIKRLVRTDVSEQVVLDFFKKKCGLKMKIKPNGKELTDKGVKNKLSDLKEKRAVLDQTIEILDLKEKIHSFVNKNTKTKIA